MVLFLDLAICSMVNLSDLQWNNFANSMSSLYAFALIIILTVLCIFTIRLVFAGGPDEDGEIDPRYETIYLGLRNEFGLEVSPYPVFFTIQRLGYAWAAVSLRGRYTGQLFTLTLMSLLMLVILLRQRPFYEPMVNKLYVFNEIVVLTSVAHLYLFTDYLKNPVTKNGIAISLIGVVVFCICVNLFYILMEVLRLFYLIYLRIKFRKDPDLRREL